MMSVENSQSDEPFLVDDLLQVVTSEREELDHLKVKINFNSVRFFMTSLDSITASDIVELQTDLNRYEELKRKYAEI